MPRETAATYIIGIDLGTSNSVVSFVKAEVAKDEQPEIFVLPIPQVISANTVEARDILPSALFLPSKGDVSRDALGLPWARESSVVVGEYAKARGAERPHQQITSAKSWLCHKLVDREGPILPWDAPDDETKISPVAASAKILAHIRSAWNYTMAADDKSLRMDNQEIFLTVPASFDAVARELTMKAARLAGLENVTLIEEPVAAFYAWIDSVGDKWREMVHEGDLVLVCDIGGGTSDFSLIRVDQEEGNLKLERIAVGDHLLVGGDNMDLALAYSVSRHLAGGGTRLDTWQMRALWHSCRQAKEKILEDSCAQHALTILGRGSALVGATITTDLTAEMVKKTVLDGFFPYCDFTDGPVKQKGTGIRELGLAYESDPAVTRHIAHFIQRQKQTAEGTSFFPTAVLFNGGVMKADVIRARIMELFSTWSQRYEGPVVREIPPHDFDRAVAKGAVYYGLARRGQGIRIRGGLGKSYYIGIAASMPAVPGVPAVTKALCVAPFGMEEGERHAAIGGREFALVVGEAARFDFLNSNTRVDDSSGEIVEDWQGEINPLTTLETTLEGEAGDVIAVTLEAHATEIGTLEIWCVGTESGRRWKLEFNLRENASSV